VGALLVLGLLAAPAGAATKPAKVGLISFTGASLSGSKATLTMTWPAARSARSYEVFVSRSYSGVMDAKVFKRTSSRTTTLSGLAPGTTYYVTVRGVNGSAKGARASRVGRTTIVSQGTGTHPARSVLTWNICSEKSECDSNGGDWKDREPTFLKTIAARRPSVLALQESKELASGRPYAIPGYTLAAYWSSKALFFDTSVYRLASSPTMPAKGREGRLTDCNNASAARYGCIALNGDDDHPATKFAVWAELEDTTTGQHVVYVSAHTTSKSNESAARARQEEARRLMAGVRAVNPEKLPVVLAGDWNSHRNRSNDYVGAELRKGGFRDAFDLARSVARQHLNSYNDWETRPTVSVTWGDHVDKVWVQPGRAVVRRWENSAVMADGRYAAPLVSDHNPVLVRVSLD
jgi:endonuclease/exonuclease/phosphatase family metal-dependent hydrolase